VFVVLLAVLSGGCWGDDPPVEEGLRCFIHGPDPTKFGDIDPFKGCATGGASCICDVVRICYIEKGESKVADADCEKYTYGDPEATLGALPLGKDVSIVVECYDKVVDPATGAILEVGPTARGQSVPVRHDSSEDVEDCTVYMLPVTTFGPTYSPATMQVTEPFEARWGAIGESLNSGQVLLAGGADLSGQCQDWSDPACVDDVSSTAEVYDPGTGAYALVTDPLTMQPQLLGEKRAFAASVVLPNGEIAIFGGFNSSNNPVNTVDIFDPYEGKFYPGKPMQHTRAYHTATLIYNKESGYVLLAGGIGSGDATWEVWTPDPAGLPVTGALAESRWHHTATLVTTELDTAARNVVMLAGGEGGDPAKPEVRSTIEVFNIDAQQIEVPRYLCSNDGIAPAPKKKTYHAAAFVPKRHFVYVVGGFSDPEHLNPVKEICVWNTKQNGEGWQGDGSFSLKKGRGALTATALPGNVVLFAGGLCKTDSGTLGACGTVEIVFEYLNADGSTVVDIGPDDDFPIPMLWPRWDHKALVSGDGKAYVFGGLSGPPTSPMPVKPTEVFNPQ
jgi:hypothetical protein